MWTVTHVCCPEYRTSYRIWVIPSNPFCFPTNWWPLVSSTALAAERATRFSTCGVGAQCGGGERGHPTGRTNLSRESHICLRDTSPAGLDEHPASRSGPHSASNNLLQESCLLLAMFATPPYIQNLGWGRAGGKRVGRGGDHEMLILQEQDHQFAKNSWEETCLRVNPEVASSYVSSLSLVLSSAGS